MLTCICCGPLPIENGIPGYLNFQEQKASQPTVSKGPSVQELRAKRVQQSIATNSGRLFLSGVLARANAVTTNNRVYDKDTLERDGQRYITNLVQAGQAFGELEHPHYSSPTFKHLHLATLSHQIITMWWHEDELHGLLEVLDTPAGRLVRSLYCQGIMLGASTRGHSSVMQPVEGQQHRVVATDLQLLAPCSEQCAVLHNLDSGTRPVGLEPLISKLFDLLMMPATQSYLFPAREQIFLGAQTTLQGKLIRAANRSVQGVMELYPKLQPGTCKDAATFEAELQALTLEPHNATTAEQQAVEDAPKCSLGTSISTAVKDVKVHLHLKGATSTGKERLLSKHRSSSSEIPLEDSQPTRIKARHGRESLQRKRASLSMSASDDTRDRLHKVQKLVDVLQFGKLDWSGGKVSREQQSDTERFLERALKGQPNYSGPPVLKRNPAPPLRAVPELQAFLSGGVHRKSTSGGGLEGVTVETIADKAPNGYAALKERTMSQGECDEMQLQEAVPLTRIPEQVVKQQLEGECCAPRPIVS